MSKLIIEVEESLLSKVLIECQKQKVDLDNFIKDALAARLSNQELSNNISISVPDVLRKTCEKARAMPLGREFLLMDICDKSDWVSLSSGERKTLGKQFKKMVEGTIPPIAKYVRRTSSNKAVYMKA